MEAKPLAYVLVVFLAMPGLVAAPSVTRAAFIPPVIFVASANRETFQAMRNQIAPCSAVATAKRFSQIHADRFDSLNVAGAGGRIGNRYHSNARSFTIGIGGGTNGVGAHFGSTGRPMGDNVLPVGAYFSGGEKAFLHATGHQWIQSMNGRAHGDYLPHGPKGTIAINVMGFSIGDKAVGGRLDPGGNGSGCASYRLAVEY